MSDASAGLHEVRLLPVPPGGRFLHTCASAILADLPDPRALSSAWLILPNLLLARDMRAALLAEAGRPLLLPRIDTLPGAVAPWLTRIDHLPDVRRQFALYQALKSRHWLDEGSLWEICAEMVALFDELTLAGVGLPESEEELAERLALAYETRAGEPLRFEARLVHTLWHAEAAGLPSRAAARLLAARAWAERADAPLYIVAEGPPGPIETAVMSAWAARAPVTVFVPDRGEASDPVLQVLNAAWPPRMQAAGSVSAVEQPPLAARAASLAAAAPLAGRLQLMPADSLEQEAAAIAACVRRWLAAGRRRIALIAADRVAARRARALLERDGVLVEDETGWKLTTSRVAATVDALLSVIGNDGYHRDVLDLAKSPFVFGDLDPAVRQAGVHALGQLHVEHNLSFGLDALAKLAGAAPPAVPLVQRLMQAVAALPRTSATPVLWLGRLEEALSRMGAMQLLAADVAGAALLEWMQTRRAELADETMRLGFFEWRDWLDRELDAAMFRDSRIASPVVMTHLAAVRLRGFDAAIVIGADAEHLAPDDRRPVFAHDGVRAELGLPDRAAARARLGEDLAGLIALSGEVCITWQRLQGSEAVLPCAEVDVLSLLHEAAFGDDLKVPLPPVPVPMHPHVGQAMPAPVLPAGRVPQRVSASGLKSLIECPYQYFGRYVLGLGEFGEVTEALEKSDYGEMIHAVLQRFHTRFPLVTGVDQEVLLAALAEETDAIFGPALARNFLEHAWLGRWRVRLPAYLDWQREREAAGWRFAGAEGRKELMLTLADGSPLMLYGRLDRIDTSVDGCTVAVLDYKTRGVKPLRDQAASPDDVQLAVYTLLRGEAVTEAAYVALDDEAVAAVPLSEPQSVAAAQRERLVAVFSALQAGAALPAHGTGACQWCEMRGLCRKDHHS